MVFVFMLIIVIMGILYKCGLLTLPCKRSKSESAPVQDPDPREAVTARDGTTTSRPSNDAHLRPDIPSAWQNIAASGPSQASHQE